MHLMPTEKKNKKRNKSKKKQENPIFGTSSNSIHSKNDTISSSSRVYEVLFFTIV
jgi:hypothetical protein